MKMRGVGMRRGWPAIGFAALAMATTAVAKPAVDPEAMAALERMGAYLRALQQMHVTSEMTTDEVLPSGQKIQHTGVADLKVRRPDRLVANIQSDRKTEQIIYDGKTLTIFQPKLGYYARTPAPPRVLEMVDMAEERYGFDFPLADLFTWGTSRSRASDILSATNVGVAEIKGTPCDHFAFHQADVDWEVWIERGARPLPRKQVITTITEQTQPQHVAVLSWDLSPKLDERMFTFTPPANAHQIELEPVEGAAGKAGLQAPLQPAQPAAPPQPAAPNSEDRGGAP
jgi:hypothetical protein